ncbi:MAG: hypothetical protein ABEI78_00235, partial [Candidatus Nanohaloarchaea archaeon]
INSTGHEVKEKSTSNIGKSTHEYNLTIDTASMETGNFTLFTNASDTAGTKQSSKTWFFLDKIPPKSKLYGIENSSWQTGKIVINYTAYDEQ